MESYSDLPSSIRNVCCFNPFNAEWTLPSIVFGRLKSSVGVKGFKRSAGFGIMQWSPQLYLMCADLNIKYDEINSLTLKATCPANLNYKKIENETFDYCSMSCLKILGKNTELQMNHLITALSLKFLGRTLKNKIKFDCRCVLFENLGENTGSDETFDCCCERASRVLTHWLLHTKCQESNQ